MTWHRAAAFADLKEGGVIGVDVAGKPIALYLLDGAVFATHNICSHQFAFLSDGYVENGCVECPLHQGLFDIRTGKAQGSPVSVDIATYPVKLEGDAVLVDLDAAESAEGDASAACAGACQSGEAPADPIVIVGAGQAGLRTAETLRKQGYEGPLLLIGDEPHLPYERPPLSKGMLDGSQTEADCLMLQPEPFAALNLDFRPSQLVVALMPAERRLRLADGSEMRYAKLLLATGARARKLPGLPDDARILTLRDFADSAAVKQQLQTAERVILLGGGFIGLEVAGLAAKQGKAVTVIEREGHLLARLLPAPAARLFQDIAEANGVQFRFGQAPSAITAQPGGIRLDFDNGESLEGDLLLVSVGSQANIELAAEAGLTVAAGGIVVDAACRSSDAHIYAAGDCALYHADPGLPAMRFESWQNAESQGKTVAAAMLDQPLPPAPLPWFWSDQFGLNVQIFGLPQPGLRAAIRRGDKPSAALALLYDGDALKAAVCFGEPPLRRKLRGLLEKNETAPPESFGAAWAPTEAAAKNDATAKDAKECPVNQQAPSTIVAPELRSYEWPAEGLIKIPDWVYTDDTIYQREVERIFHGRTWNYVALEAEIPEAGDYVRSNVGPTPVVVARAEDGSINVFENRCAHRAAEFCRDLRGNAKEFVCPYHQWSYDLRGNLAGVPFRRGVDGKGGMPKDFKTAEHSLRKLKVTTRGGVVFASYDRDIESLEEYLGADILREFDATFDGRKLKVLGYYRNTLPGNWKLYHENLKDPYHATLLHTFLVTFGLLVAGNKSLMLCDPSGRHGVMASAKSDGATVSEASRKEMRAYKEGMVLQEPRFMDFIEEFDSPWSVTMSTIWPNLIVQREMNTLGLRQIVPNGPHEFTMIWTMFGFEGDDAEMTRHRLRQGNLMGPAGFLGLEDNEAMKFVQDGMKSVPNGEHLVALDPNTPAGTSDTLISESAIRAMYAHWRDVMGV